MTPDEITALCKKLEAFETPRWAIESVLNVELTTRDVLDPCSGTGIIPAVLSRLGHIRIHAFDIVDWSQILPDAVLWDSLVRDFLKTDESLHGMTVMMNPPFSLAHQFVTHALDLGARKVICFQRHAWRESRERRAFWEANPPARIWICGARASCFRFDLLQCHHADGQGACPNAKRRGKKQETQGCMHCMGGAPTAHSWFVWERGHKGAEITSAIYPRDKT